MVATLALARAKSCGLQETGGRGAAICRRPSAVARQAAEGVVSFGEKIAIFPALSASRSSSPRPSDCGRPFLVWRTLATAWEARIDFLRRKKGRTTTYVDGCDGGIVVIFGWFRAEIWG